jgi:hypothetical protein
MCQRPPAGDAADFVAALSRTAAILVAHLEDSVLALPELSWIGYRLLRLVSLSVPITLDTAAVSLILPVPDVALAATRLSALGWTRIQIDGDDTVTLQATASGLAVVNELRDRIADAESRLLCPLPGEVLDRVHIALRVAAARAGAAGPCILPQPLQAARRDRPDREPPENWPRRHAAGPTGW